MPSAAACCSHSEMPRATALTWPASLLFMRSLNLLATSSESLGATLVALVVKPANGGFEATFRVVSYSNVAQLVGWVPVLGPLVAAVASVVLSVIGVREVHETTTGKAALVVLIPAAVGLFIALLLIALVGALLFASQ
jgi:hypothetical protein